MTSSTQSALVITEAMVVDSESKIDKTESEILGEENTDTNIIYFEIHKDTLEAIEFNKDTLEAIGEAKGMNGLKSFSDIEELFEYLDS